MSAVDILGLSIPLVFLAMLGLEALVPARAFPKIRGWRLMGVAFLLQAIAVGTMVPLLLPLDFVAAHRLFDGSQLGVAGGAVVGFVVVELMVYAYHRSCHRFGFLWRWVHQMHHSARRLDMGGAMVFHPFELLLQNVLLLGTVVFLLGLDPLAGAIVGFTAGFYGLFQHLNVRTPRWLGYIIQRPEAHGLHHSRGVHGYNYADLPLWDMLFGTWRNPDRFEGEVGFGQPVSFGAMLAGRDVSGGRGYGLDAREQQSRTSILSA
jgi:sterol desaturase/sphingolipid hydroxylase (fatty acid hydroxylase superfamily)